MYLKQIEDTIHTNISNQSLVSCARIAELIKTPPVIPHYEAFTFSLLARYFGLTEKRLRNAYNTNRHIFANDSTQVTGSQMLHYVNDVKSLGVHYGYLCEFDNGVVVQVSYTTNMIFNYRALLHFAVILKDDSEVAKKIYDVLHSNEYRNKGYLNKKIPWFSEIEAEPVTTVVCPYAEASNSKQTRGNNRRRKVNQLNENGKVIYTWASMYEAANVLGINYSSVNACCNGKAQTAGSGKYRFVYAD